MIGTVDHIHKHLFIFAEVDDEQPSELSVIPIVFHGQFSNGRHPKWVVCIHNLLIDWKRKRNHIATY